jgi:hypothetical protein
MGNNNLLLPQKIKNVLMIALQSKPIPDPIVILGVIHRTWLQCHKNLHHIALLCISYDKDSHLDAIGR